MPNSNIVYPFKQVFEVMKPNKIKEDNPNQRKKLEECMNSSEYAIEEKIDGHHYTCIGSRFFSTHISEKTGFPVEKTDNFPHISEIIHYGGFGQLILDGEINYPGKKAQDISSVSNSAPDKAISIQEKQGWINYTVYDILRAPNGEWLINKPWRERREYLEAIGTKLNTMSKHLIVNPVTYNNKQEFVDRIMEEGGEGGVLKFLNGLYIPGKRPMWNQMKIKQEMEDDVVITGYLDPKRIYDGKNVETWKFWEGEVPVTSHWYHKLIGSIRIGKYRNGELVELGSVTGMTEAERREFTTNGDKYIGTVIKIRGMEKTNDGAYRHFNFVEIHGDKNARECILT